MPTTIHFLTSSMYKHLCPAKRLITVMICALGALSQNLVALEIDGQLKEAQWQSAQTLSLDKTVEPFTFNNPSVTTEVKYFTTQDGIYVAVTAMQSKKAQTTVRTARDRVLESDAIELIIDFDNSQNNAYGFVLGNGGSMRDGIWQNNNQFKSDWDGDWLGKTTQNDHSWTAEYLIPWTVAPMAKVQGAERDIRIYVSRHDIKSGKKYSHAKTASTQTDFIREFTPIKVNNHASHSLDVFASASYQRDRLAQSNNKNISADIFWRPDASQQLSVALNPDFGQVESDNLVVNFTPFESFFSERRPFFTQNQALFDVQGNSGLRLVHTRRIGADNDIKAAVKYTKNSQNIDFGSMLAVEDDTNEGLEGNRFATIRGQYKNEDSQIGYLATYSDKSSDDIQAQVHSIDFRKDLSDTIQVQGQVTASFIDNNNDIDDENGQGGWFNISQKFTDNWLHQLKLTRYSDDFQVNDMGYLSRNDTQSIFYLNQRYFTGYSSDHALKQRELNFGGTIEHNIDGEHLNTNVFLGGGEDYKDTSSLSWNLDLFFAGKDDTTTRGNGDFNTHFGKMLYLNYDFGSQSKVRHKAILIAYDEYILGLGARANYSLSYYMTDNYRLSWSFWYKQRRNSLFWLDDQLARYAYKELKNTLDFEATIDDKQELRMRFQWISITGKEGDPYDIDQQGELFASNKVVNDFSRSTTRLQIRYRYELAPLSNIYLVYSRGGYSEDDLQQSNLALFDEGWGERTGDNLIAKIRYRF